ncbi:MAG: DedA family protein [Bacteroidales bacterium]|nr:DedA family protein [Bacteroidales bacterium]
MAAFYESVIAWYMMHMNYFTITVLMTIESSFLPFPSEVVIPPAAWKAAQGDLDLGLVILFGTLGALLGAIINYYLAKSLGKMIIYRFADSRLGRMCLLDSNKIKKAEAYFIRYGNISTFIGRLVPGIRQLISIPAGLAEMPLRPFLLYTTLGALMWNIILAVLGYYLQSQQELFNQYYSELSLGFGLLAVILVAYLIYKGLSKPKTE